MERRDEQTSTVSESRGTKAQIATGDVLDGESGVSGAPVVLTSEARDVQRSEGLKVAGVVEFSGSLTNAMLPTRKIVICYGNEFLYVGHLREINELRRTGEELGSTMHANAGAKVNERSCACRVPIQCPCELRVKLTHKR